MTKTGQTEADAPDGAYGLLSKIPEGKHLIVFDGECLLCNRLIRLLIKLDRKKKLIFTTSGSSLFAGDHLSAVTGKSLILINHRGTYTGAAAVTEISRLFNELFLITAMLRLLPARWREALYRFVAKNRYRIFGRSRHCMLPRENEAGRFI